MTDEHILLTKEYIDQSCVSPVGTGVTNNTDVDEVRQAVSNKMSNSIENKERNIKVNSEIVTIEAMQQEEDILAALEFDSHIVQNAEISLSIKEQKITEPKVTSPVDIQPADYTIREDYPNTYGFVDTVKNWFKINKERGHAEFVHQSGSYFKIDKDGNVSFYITGSMKQIIEGDYSLEVRKNMDTLVKKNSYKHIVKNSEELVGGTFLDTVVKSVTQKYQSVKNENVSGTVTENYGGSHNTTISGSKNEKAASVNHN